MDTISGRLFVSIPGFELEFCQVGDAAQKPELFTSTFGYEDTAPAAVIESSVVGLCGDESALSRTFGR
jgi:hypothetical protein